MVVVGGPLLVVVTAVIVLVTQFQTAYLTNDDTVVASLIYGDYTGKRTSALVVVPALFGHLVRLFTAVFPSLPWYGISLYALQIIGWTAIGSIFFTLRRRPPVAERIVAAATIVLIAPWMILRIGYTSTSLFLGGVGIILFAVSAKVRGRLGTAYAVLGGVFLGTTYLLRANGLLAIAAAFAPVFVIIGRKAGLRRSFAFGLVIGVFVIGVWGANRLEYSSPGWREFMKMNSARGALADTPRLDDKRVSDADLRSIGWTRNDLWLFRDFTFPDTKVYNTDSIRTLAKLSPWARNKQIGATQVFNAFFRFGADEERRTDKGVVVAPLLLIAVVLALLRGRRIAALTAVAVIWFLAVLIAIMLYNRLPGRLLTPLVADATLVAVALPAYLGARVSRVRHRYSPASIAVIVITALAVTAPVIDGLWGVPRTSANSKANIAAFRATYAWLESFDPQGTFVGRADLFNSWGDPLSNHTAYTNLHFLPPGWLTNSPSFRARLARLGISDEYDALRTNPHMYLVGPLWKAAATQNFYREHRGLNVSMTRHGNLRYPDPIGTMQVWSVTASARKTALSGQTRSAG
jgi:hypothetical protein